MEKKNEVTVAGNEPIEETIKTAIRQQVAVIGEIELRGNFEKLKLGAMVSEAVKRLQIDGAQTGRGHAGGGAVGWWGEVCPLKPSGEPVIAYRTVMMWKQAAENLPQLMGVGVMNADKMIQLMAENPEEAVGKDAKILESAEKAANGMTMRQMLLWGGEEEKKRGRQVWSGPAVHLKALSEVNVVEAMFMDLTKLMEVMNKYAKVLMKNAPAIAARHPNECADFAQVAKDYARSFGK